MNLTNWNAHFEASLEQISFEDRSRAGSLLPVIPNRQQWEEFLSQVKAEWRAWRRNLSLHRYCLIVFYGGLAFYEYAEATFWPQFAKAVNEGVPTFTLFSEGNTAVQKTLAANRRTEINHEFAEAASGIGLKILRRQSGTDYVGSAVYHIGVPLSLWDGFLDFCECELDEWRAMSEEKWYEAVARRAGSRTRLKNFLQENREAAIQFIQEMQDARKILTEDEQLTVSDLKQACILRQEYFDEVPETAEFLRPSNPESLFHDRARLVWDEQRCRISLHLPAITRAKLPAMWNIGGLEQPGASTPDAMTLNTTAFSPRLLVQLTSGSQRETQLVRGIFPWGLFDLTKNRFVNPERQQLPVGGYELISREKLDDLSRKGFDEEEYPANESFELEDGTVCYLTRLWPRGKSPELTFSHVGQKTKIRFRPAARIEARFFAAEGSQAAHFTRFDSLLKIETLPLLCVAIPNGFANDNLAILRKKFEICLDDAQRLRVYGGWEKRHEDETREYYFWRWAGKPVGEKREAQTFHSLAELRPADFTPPNLIGRRTISIKAPTLGMNFEQQIEIVKSKPGLDECWKKLPGAFLPWFLLCQSPDGMKWSELLLAKEAIAPQEKEFSEALLRKYARYGLLEQRGQIWKIADSRVVFKPSVHGMCHVLFCGDPSVLWGMYRFIVSSNPELLTQRTIWRPGEAMRPVPIIEVMNERGQLPYLLMRWQQDMRDEVQTYLERHNVRIVSDLWGE